jgi:hypothetical protein
MVAIKIPTRDIVNIESQPISASEIDFLLFRQIGGTELITLIRNDTVSSEDLLYSVISDVNKTKVNFDPSLLLTNKASYQSIFNGFQIKLTEKIPEENLYRSNDQDYIPASSLLTNAYWDGDNLIIEVNSLRDTELLEIEIESDGKIYRVRENDYQ